MQKIAVIVDDHPMCRQATAAALHVVDPDIVIIEAASLADARAHAPHAALMTLDLALPDNRGVLGLPALRQEYPDLPLLVITAASNPAIESQIAAAGAHGYLSKAARISEMIDAIRAVLANEKWFSRDIDSSVESNLDFQRLASLTVAQWRVFRAMESGRLNKQIAHDLGLSEITIKAHVKAILKKLGVANRTQAILTLRMVEA